MFLHVAQRSAREVYKAASTALLPLCHTKIPNHLPKSVGKPYLDWKPIHPCLLKWFLGLTPAIRSVDTCHESFIVTGGEWIISGTQVLSQRGSDLTRSIYTLSLWIRPRECHTAAQSSLLLLHPLVPHPTVCTITEWRATHGDIKMTASGLLYKKKKMSQVMMARGPSSSRLMLSWAVARKAEREGKKTCQYSEALKEG